MARHKCLIEIDKILAAGNTQLVQNIMNANHVFLEVEKIDKTKKTKLKNVIASHCPICGKKL